MERDGYADIVDLLFSRIKIHKGIRRFIARYSNYALVFSLLLLFYVFNTKAFVVILFFGVCILSMQHLRYFSWLGAPDMNLILTAYTSINYGLPAGLLMGNASFFGLLLSGDVDSNLFFDIGFSYITAVIASFFTMQYYVPLMIFLVCIHFITFFAYHKIVGTLDPLNVVWIITHSAWVLFFATKICSLFGLC